MNNAELIRLRETYRNGLLNDTLPFWTHRAPDNEFGGFIFFLDRKGQIYDTDKGIWQQARFTWLLASLFNEVEKREEWLNLARHGIDFLMKYGFDSDGRMFFHLNQKGDPIRKRRYIFSETFTIIALAAWAKASGEQWAAEKAHQLWEFVLHLLHTPGLLDPKFTKNREMKGLSIPMILMVTAQELRKNLGDHGYSDTITRLVGKIRSDWMKPEFKAVMENVGLNGDFIDHADGRILNPGHAIEASWFIMQEAEFRNDSFMLETALTILDWMWDWGWDEEYGGIRYYVDVKNLPVVEYWHDMKFWWPQNEALIATLMAYRMSGEVAYADKHKKLHDWVYQRFPDHEYGEWFGYLHRDGRVSADLKGNLWKGPFHLPRMQWLCWNECEKIISNYEKKQAG